MGNSLTNIMLYKSNIAERGSSLKISKDSTVFLITFPMHENQFYKING